MKGCRRCLVAALFVFIIGHAQSRAEEIGIVLVENLNLRPQAGTETPALDQLEKGSEVAILSRRNGWLQVRHQDRVGYVKDSPEYIRIVTVAADGDHSRLDGYRQEAEKLDRELQAAEKALRQTAREESAVLDKIDALARNIHSIRRKIGAGRTELEALEKQIEANRGAYEKLRQHIEANDAYVAGRLVALFKLNRYGTLPFLASADSLSELLQRKKSLEYILRHDETVRANLTRDLEQRRRIGQQLQDQKARKRRVEMALETDLRALADRKSKREQILARIRNEKSLQQEAIDSLKEAAETLDRTVATLMESEPEIIENPSLTSFSSLRGLLKMPVQGKIINFFGPQKNARFDVTVFRSGIDIRADSGAVIQAVYAGRVMYADWFKGYGNLIIIDHGDSYYTVYAHLETLLKKTGETVNTGEDIATVGDTALMAEPVLHFEVRHHGTPLDPLEWIVRG